MIELPEIGKISPEVFNALIFPRLGAASEKVLIGPQHGVDVGIVEIGDQAVALTTDPVFIVPEYGWRRAAWFAIHILASDAVTSGLKPTFLSIDLNLPMSITSDQLTAIWETIDSECRRLGISIVSGHTAKYENCGYPMVGGATVICVGSTDEYVSPKFIRSGDRIIITKGPAIEAAGIFSAMFPEVIAREFGDEFQKRSEDIFWRMSVVEDALSAVQVGVRDGGVTAMHDATECGIWGALCEIAQASGLGLRVEKELIVTDEDVLKICRFFDIDPYSSISEGTLVITARPHKADEIVSVLGEKGIRSSVIGEMTGEGDGLRLIENGVEKELKHPIVDPFWKAFSDSVKRYSL